MTGQQLKQQILQSGYTVSKMAELLDVTFNGLSYQLKKEQPAIVYVIAIKAIKNKGLNNND